MIGRIIGLVSCLLCSFPFWIVAIFNKDSKEPINFWSGDTTLKTKVKNIKEYNRDMTMLYRKCAIAFLITGVAFFVLPAAGIVLIALDCSIGIYIMYKQYKQILNMYS